MTVFQRRMKKVSILLVFLFVFSLVGPYLPQPGSFGAGMPTAKAAEPQTIGDLDIGDKVVDNSWEWEHRLANGYTQTAEDVTKPVTWIVVAKDHYGAGGVTLLTEEIIARHRFDNSTDRGDTRGSNHWGDSGSTDADYGIRRFLNGSSYDYASGYDGTYEGAEEATGDDNSYDITFFDSFSDDFKNAVLTTEVPCRENDGTWGEDDNPYNYEEYTTLDRVFLPSQVELNGATGHNHSAEAVWPYFDGAVNADRITLESNGYNFWYWTRSPSVAIAYYVRSVNTFGSLYYYNANYGSGGVRPALNLSSETPISGIPNEDGAYEIQHEGEPPDPDPQQTPAPDITTEAQTVSTATISIDGTAEANATIHITGGASEATGKADGEGNFNIEVTLTSDTVNNISVTAMAPDKLESEAATVAITHETEEIPDPDDPYKQAEVAVNSLFDDDGKLLDDVTQEEIDNATAMVTDLEDGSTKNELFRKLVEAQDQYDERQETLKCGDVTGDGNIAVSDAILVLRHIVGLITLDEDQISRANVSGGEEELAVGDAILILRHIVGLIEQFPAEE